MVRNELKSLRRELPSRQQLVAVIAMLEAIKKDSDGAAAADGESA